MDVELTNMHRLDSPDRRPPPAPTDTNISMTAASNPAYATDNEELRHRKASSIHDLSSFSVSISRIHS